ncbi:uncharacterized protein LOC126907847 isoform X2 [Daktulosphaira vitifoliae]|uniref:uncharacterized protein LOC126907847 isoform X1 n=1 Tax=Daktulosphaira vitifoliae TaxID=58002 RepID=UPI0021AAB4D1|nr:uncharacterized protein LOC126907847 isoform X1 [Daktulosphaira vitifoliae]XP_050545438.1 uncharacterized protein LOC126907847 isoform X1 [Daktulosphaira vitifoliae]XP_050545439.1 uncharacterized protein LOC126907847 isoform X2 [Daktulosphaira vitifoliae]
MFSLNIVKLIFLLFYFILYTKAKTNSQKTIDQLDKLLMYPGWKNIKDIKYIKYYDAKYYLQNLIKTPTHGLQLAHKIRALTIYLGCTYAKVMNNLFSIIFNCIQFFKIQNDLINGCIYTEELINIISKLIVPMATLMKGAMDTLDLLHNKPWATFKRNCNHYIMSRVLGRIGDILDKLNHRTLFSVDISVYIATLDLIYSFFNEINTYLEHDTYQYCELVPYDENYLWNKWVQEYKVIHNDKKFVFLQFLSRKIKNYIMEEIQKKYFELGFLFDPITEETFIPTSESLIYPEIEFK